MQDPNTVSLPSTQDSNTIGGLCKIAATVRNIGVNTTKTWREEDVIEAFEFCTRNNFFQDASRFAIDDPVPGDAYCLFAKNVNSEFWYHDMKLDSHTWTEQNTPSMISNKHAVSHRKFIAMTATGPSKRKVATSRFRKHVYYDSATTNCIIFYQGTLDGIVRAPHGNSKGQRPHFTASKELAHAIQKDADLGRTAGQTLGSIKANIPGGMVPFL